MIGTAIFGISIVCPNLLISPVPRTTSQGVPERYRKESKGIGSLPFRRKYCHDFMLFLPSVLFFVKFCIYLLNKRQRYRHSILRWQRCSMETSELVTIKNLCWTLDVPSRPGPGWYFAKGKFINGTRVDLKCRGIINFYKIPHRTCIIP